MVYDSLQLVLWMIQTSSFNENLVSMPHLFVSVPPAHSGGRDRCEQGVLLPCTNYDTTITSIGQLTIPNFVVDFLCRLEL